MSRRLSLIALLGCGCIAPTSSACPDGSYCAEGTVCRVVHDDNDTDETVCATPEQLAACDGTADHVACAAHGACHGGACLPIVCGDHRIDMPAEACDDGNTVSGDGCSASCASDETCGNGSIDLARGELCDDHNLRSHDGCDSKCRPETVEWLPSQPFQPLFPDGAPSWRTGAAMAYDIHRDRLVVFGGTDSRTNSLLDDTWEWDGRAWSKLAPVRAPIPRHDARMVYDSNRRRIVMWGGTTGPTSSTEIWEWDGTSWHLVPTSITPPPRFDFGMAYDPIDRAVVVYGGIAANDTPIGKSDMWKWDGASWTQIALDPANRPPNGATAMIYDPVAAGLFAVIGNAAETWRYDGAWHQLSDNAGHTLRAAHAQIAFDTAERAPLLFGGVDGGAPVDDTWLWDGTAWQLRATSRTPGLLDTPALGAIPTRGQIVLVGGVGPPATPGTPDSLDDVDRTWLWDGRDWALDLAHPPTGAVIAVATDRLSRRTMLLTTDGTYEPGNFGLGPVKVPPVGVPHGPFGTSAGAWDRADGVAIVTSCAPACTTWEWDHAAWKDVTPASQPMDLASPLAAYDEARGELVLVETSTSEMWTWRAGEWVGGAPPAMPSPRNGAVMAWDWIRRAIVLYGGTAQDTGASLDDTWSYDGTTWTQLAPMDRPPGRAGASLVWDDPLGMLVLIGGQQETYFGDTWAWDGTDWTILGVASSPPDRARTALVPITDGTGIFLWGGQTAAGSQGRVDDLYVMRYDGSNPDEGCRDSFDGDDDGLAGCADPDCWAYCTPLCPPGAACDPAAPRCGDGTCNEDLENCRLCPSDCECTAYCGDAYCDAGESHADCPGDCL